MQKYRVIRNESLKHHGILGQKWGKKNGPPYPLSPSKHSAAEKKAGWQNSLSKNSPSMPQGGAGGGGADPEDEDDQKILQELYAELEKESKRLGISPMELLSSQNFGLTLGEVTGKGDGLKDSDLERLRKKAFEHYSKGPADLVLQTTKYAKNEAELIRDQINRGDRKAPTTNTSNRSNNTYTLTDKGLQKEEDKSVWDKIKGKIFGETKVTYEDAKLEDKKGNTNDAKKNTNNNTNTYTLTDKGLQKEEDKSVWDKIKGKVFGETKVTYEDAKLEGKKDSNNSSDKIKTEWIDENTQKVGNLYVTHEASTVLNTDPSEYKTKTSFKDTINEAKDWVSNLFGKSEKKTMTIQDAMRIENEWRAQGLTTEEIDKKFIEEYGDYIVKSGK